MSNRRVAVAVFGTVTDRVTVEVLADPLLPKFAQVVPLCGKPMAGSLVATAVPPKVQPVVPDSNPGLLVMVLAPSSSCPEQVQ